MKILDYNAAEQLYKKVESLADQPHDSWRCIHINLNREQRINAGRRARFVIPTLIRLLADLEGCIYLCEDGDIFILFQGQVKPIIARLANHFADLNPWMDSEDAPDSSLTVFDLSKYWQPFFNLCLVKSLNIASA